jgi:hypothetical protein
MANADRRATWIASEIEAYILNRTEAEITRQLEFKPKLRIDDF